MSEENILAIHTSVKYFRLDHSGGLTLPSLDTNHMTVFPSIHTLGGISNVALALRKRCLLFARTSALSSKSECYCHMGKQMPSVSLLSSHSLNQVTGLDQSLQSSPSPLLKSQFIVISRDKKCCLKF